MWRFGILYPFGFFAAVVLISLYLFDLDVLEADASICFQRLDFSGFTTIEAVFLLWVWPITALSIKRFHDIGFSGFWYLMCWVVSFLGYEFISAYGAANHNLTFFENFMNDFFGFPDCYLGTVDRLPDWLLRSGFYFSPLFDFVIIVLPLLAKGQIGDNRYGADPLG